MDQQLLDETAFSIFSKHFLTEGYDTDDIAIMWAAKGAFLTERATAYADAAIAITKARAPLPKTHIERA